MGRFVDRISELEALRSRMDRPASLSLFYGQRRVGKTFLLQYFLEELQRTDPQTDTFYFLADESTGPALLRRFHEEIGASSLGGELWSSTRPADWGTTLTLLVRGLRSDRRVVVVLDELQYLLAAEPALSSILQRIWDTVRPRGGLHLILCGSALGTLSRLGDQNQPLHGRFDLRVKLRPFAFPEASEFVRSWSQLDQLRAYGIFGGLARHLAEIDPESDLATNAQNALVDPLGPLHEAPLDLLRTERLNDHASANAVLGAVARGENRFAMIASRTGLTSNRLAYVLEELLELEILVRQQRFGDKPGARFSRYRCRDPLTTFWFRCVQPQRSALMGSSPETIWVDRIAEALDDHMGAIFEEVVREALIRGGTVLGPVDEIAPWWSRDGQTEVDWVARSGDRHLFVECKWRANGEVRSRDLERLRRHVARSTVGVRDPEYCLATAGQFSERLRALEAAGEVTLLGLPHLESAEA